MATIKELPEYHQNILIDMMTVMSENEKNNLEQQLEQVDLKAVHDLYEEVYVNRNIEVPAEEVTDIEVEIKDEMQQERKERLIDIGLQAIQKRQFAALLMAGGQGTRLQHPGPKGTFSFDGISLFEMQAKQLLKLNQELNVTIPWYIMTSSINHEETLEFFKENDYFNYDMDAVTFFKQPNIVALSPEGDLLLDKEMNILKAPNGNGGVFEALQATGIYDEMKRQGVEYIYLNNIDNVLVKVMDPLLAGLAVESAADVTTKTIAPIEGESVGRVIMSGSKKQVMEYTELPAGMENRFSNANIGIHIFKRSFLEEASGKKLPYHLAVKNMEQLDADFEPVKKETLKFEKFYFDIFQYAETFASLQVNRSEEFSPLKNKEGKDSIESARKALIDNNVLKVNE